MSTATPPQPNLPKLLLRSGVGGILMGLANLVPGISGGTMLLAAGIYPRFIQAISDLTKFKFTRDAILVLGTVVVAALIAIVTLAGPVKHLVVTQRWIMYSLFIGLTLGGVPVVWGLLKQSATTIKPIAWLAAIIGFIGMALLAWFQMSGSSGNVDNSGWVMLFIAGIAGASAMILPGVSGGYLLLVLGTYVPILAGIAAFKDALSDRSIDAMMDPALNVVLPVGLGVLVGVIVVSNLLKFFLDKFEQATLGVLLGLLIGAVVGLYPFQAGVAPEPGDTLKNQTVQLNENNELIYADTAKLVEPEDYPTTIFTPSARQIVASLGLILVGFAITAAIAHLGRDKPTQSEAQSTDTLNETRSSPDNPSEQS